MNIHSIDRLDLVNTPGEDKPAFTIWFAGCHVGCKGCHNKELWSRAGGTHYRTSEIMVSIMRQPIKYDSLVLLGGEPMEQDMDELMDLCMVAKSLGLNIWMYTSYSLHEIPIALLCLLYTVKTGKYDESQLTGGFPASANQRVWRNDNGQWIDITERMGSINANQYDT